MPSVRPRILAALLLAAATTASAERPPTTRVAQGAIAGIHDGKVAAYLGLPFAAPPVGPLRWRAPVAPAAWTGERSARAFAPNCQQSAPNGPLRAWTEEYLITGPIGEDCLYLNVWTPATSQAARLPVLVWIHGGGFVSGGASVPVYHGAPLAAQGIVVVTLNYRLGVYGFLAHPALAAENSAKAAGNYGLLDQVAALRWVRENIAAFGGDPRRVTIAGQSAGAAAVHHLIAAPMAQGLFAQAIAQSGSSLRPMLAERASAEQAAEQLMTAAGVAGLDVLRALPPERIDAAVAAARAGFRPIADGMLLPDAGPAGADVPILTGLTADEGSSLSANYGQATAASLSASLAERFGAMAGEFGALYGAASDDAAGAAAIDLARDSSLASLHGWAQRRLGASRQPVYAYLWSHVEPGPQADFYRAFHSSELPYMFGTLDTAPRPFTAQDRTLARQMQAYWVNWVKRGNPNGAGLPAWPRYDPAAPRIMGLHVKPAARALLEPRKLALFERFIRAGGAPAPY